MIKKIITEISNCLQIPLDPSNCRIKQYHKGWVIERKKRFMFYTYWVHAVSSAGLPKCPWYYSSYRFAKKDLDKILSGDTWYLRNELV